MDLQKWLVWAVTLVVLGFGYSMWSGMGFMALLTDWWLVALLSALVIAWAPDMTIEFETGSADWIAWLLVMCVLFGAYGLLAGGGVLALFTMWHWGVALVSALVMYFVAPWGKQYIPA
ncbi:hypothetical protein JNK62_04135 [bacterium]|nr:hypothetical protein [bacterium]